MDQPIRRRRRRGSPIHHDPAAVTYARENAGMTQQALAGAAGISIQLMCDIEAGRRNAGPDRLQVFAETLGCPVTVLEAKVPQQTRARP